MTNADKIRQMTDKELAEMYNELIQDCEYCPLYKSCIDEQYISCPDMYLKWLRQEAPTA